MQGHLSGHTPTDWYSISRIQSKDPYMKAHSFIFRLSNIIIALGLFSAANAGGPVWTFLPLRATTISVSTSDTATIQYQVTNQSSKTHVLEMRGITGISQNTTPGYCANPFTLGYQQSCTLTLTVDGSSLQGSVAGGPVVCQQGNALQCYQPRRSDALNITLTTAPGATRLTTSVSHLALSQTGYTEYGVSGTPSSGLARTITVTNTGSNATSNLSISYPTWPGTTTPTTASDDCPLSLAASSSCTITITPGNTATSNGASACTTGVAPTPQTITISADNADTVSSTAVILGYGCIYQGGYVYALDDTTSPSTSVGGKVAGLTNVSNNNAWTGPRVNIAGAESTTNGAQNTTDIVASTSCTDDPDSCAAYQCRINFAGGGNTDWYLPAICEEGYDATASNSGCGTLGSPTLQNMQSNLVDIGNVGSLDGPYWSSTEFYDIPADAAWYQSFASIGSSQIAYYKFFTYGVRCSRALTL